MRPKPHFKSVLNFHSIISPPGNSLPKKLHRKANKDSVIMVPIKQSHYLEFS